jgi:hypothetical protein
MPYSVAQFALRKGTKAKKLPPLTGGSLWEAVCLKKLVRAARKQGDQHHQVRWGEQPLVRL